MKAALAADPGAVAVTTDHDELNVATGRRRHVPADFHGRITRDIFAYRLPLPSCTVVRADALRRAGGFNESYRQGLEDVELFLCMSLLGPWKSVPGEPVVRRLQTREVFGGPDQLSTEHERRGDSHRATLRLFDRFLFKLGGAAVIDAAAWSLQARPLWQRWHYEAVQSRSLADALECVQHILMHTGRGDPALAAALAREWRAAGKALERSGDLRAAARWHRALARWDRHWLRCWSKAIRLWLRSLGKPHRPAAPAP
jgi:hypothetical protein